MLQGKGPMAKTERPRTTLDVWREDEYDMDEPLGEAHEN